jgi:phasin family protein
MLTIEQVIQAQKAQLDALLGWTNQIVEGVEQIVELSLHTTKDTLADTAQGARAALDAKDIQEVISAQMAFLQPCVEKAATYSRQVYNITSGLGARWGQAVEAQAGDVQKAWVSLLDNASQNAPAGSETAVAVIKGAMTAANNAAESVQKVIKQAASMAEANFNAVADSAVNSAKNAGTRASKKGGA